MQLIRHLRCRCGHAREAGFTLIELVVTVAIVGFVAVALTGMVMEYLKTTISTSARLSESHDIQFVSAYWQRDVASIGVRSDTYDASDPVHTFPLQQSVSPDGSLASCALPSGTKVITLAWSTYTLDAAANPSQTVTTVTYVAKQVGTTYSLARVLCSGAASKFTLQVADHLVAIPTIACSGGGVAGCGDTSGKVPTTITLTLKSTDPNNNDHTTYTQTLLGERRQT